MSNVTTWYNEIKNICVLKEKILVVVDDGAVSGEARIVVEPFGVVRYFFVPQYSGFRFRVSGFRLEPDTRHLTPDTMRRVSRSLTIILKEGSKAEIYGAVLAEQDNQYQFNLLVHHLGPRSQSRTLFKGVGKDTSKQVFNGMIKIEKQANQSNAFLENRVLLLSKHATAESKPELEIEANDVKASHAATTGRIDDKQLFYLQTRGIDRGLAQEMIVRGFLDEVIRLLSSIGNKGNFIPLL